MGSLSVEEARATNFEFLIRLFSKSWVAWEITNFVVIISSKRKGYRLLGFSKSSDGGCTIGWWYKAFNFGGIL